MHIKQRLLALDIGDTWIGIAHTIPDSKIVFPFATWKKDIFRKEFVQYTTRYIVTKVIVGLPLTLNNTKSEQTKKIIAWKEEEERFFSQFSFIFFDERLTSQFAKNILHSSPSFAKQSEHAIAAAIILENYLIYEENNIHN